MYLRTAPPLILLLSGIALYMIRFRNAPAIRSLLAFFGLTIYLLVTTLLELNARSDTWTQIFGHLQYVAFIAIPVSWLMFALKTTGLVRSDSKIRFTVLSTLAGILFVATVVFADLLWVDFEYVRYRDFSFLAPVHGPLFWVVFALAYSMIASGTLLILGSFFRSRTSNYRQSIWFILGSLMPGIANISYLFDFLPENTIDFTPIGFAVAGVLFFIAVYFHKMLWVLPVTRSVILQEMKRPMLVLEPRGWILDMNKSFENLLGIDKIAIGTNSRMSQPLREFLETIGLFSSEDRTVVYPSSGKYAKDGRTYSWELQTAGMPNHAMVISLEDITEQLQMEEHMFHLKDEFMKREKHATIGKLAAGVAHEVNNPLAFIKSNVRTLSTMLQNPDTAGDGEVEEILGSINNGLTRIEESTQSLLHLGRADQPDAPVQIFTFTELCERTLTLMKYEIRNHCRIATDLRSTALIRGYPNEINQVIFNILHNAIHAISESEIGSTDGLITLRSEDDGGIAWLEIENNGAPIEDTVAPHIFDMFYTTKNHELGSGIGLSISKDLVEQRNFGRLILRSRDPVIFRIELPVAP